MMDGDIYGDVLLCCQVSSSQEEHLRSTSFAQEPCAAAQPHPSDSDSDSVPVDSTAIMMVSPPDSLDDFRDAVNNNTSVSTCPSHDVFQTPPEDSVEPSPPPPPAVDAGSQTVVVDVGFVDDSGTGTVELGVDSDLGFSEAQESERFRVLSGEEPLEKWKWAGGTERETGSEFMDAEIGEERWARRKVELEWVGSEKEAARELVETRRRLPDWKQSGDEVRRVQSKSSYCEGSENFSILDALKWFKENGGDDDDSVPTSGFVEICEKKGMAFPRPTWWL